MKTSEAPGEVSGPKISVIVPVFNQSHLTQRCLASLQANTRWARELIVIDNHSTDNTPLVLDRFEKSFTTAGWAFSTIRYEVNQGFGRACNAGIRAASGDFVVILNNDTWLMPGWDEVLFRRMSKLKVDMIAPHYDESPFDERKTAEKALRFVRRNQGKVKSEWVSILMFFRKSSLYTLGEALGPFDERFFVTYEDADLKERMQRAGLRYCQIGDCSIWHFSKGTRGQVEMPSGYEAEGLRLFQDKWGFDPCAAERTLRMRLKRRWNKIKTRLGRF
jgi:GT2 family glycosyltransferase